MILPQQQNLNTQLLFQDYNGSNSFVFVNTIKIYHSKAKYSEIKDIPCVQEIFQEIFQVITWKKTGLNGCVYNFSVDYKAFDISDITNIHKYLMKKT